MSCAEGAAAYITSGCCALNMGAAHDQINHDQIKIGIGVPFKPFLLISQKVRFGMLCLK